MTTGWNQKAAESADARGGIRAWGAAFLSVLEETASTLLDVVYPRICVACGSRSDAVSGHLCWDCLREAPAIEEPFCSRCGDPVDGRIESGYVCSWCVDREPAFDLARSAVRYRGAVRRAIHVFKYGRTPQVADILSRWLTGCVQSHFGHLHVDAVTCVPLHAKRQRERTYNQAALLATRLARALDRPFLGNLLRRTKSTPSQTSLSAHQRRENVRGAFRVRRPQRIAGKSLILVDDIMTTGATMNACAACLKKAGTRHVYAASVARG